MSEAAEFNSASAFEIVAPRRQSLPLVFNSPHSGRRYPASFLSLSRLDSWTIRRSEDTFVDELFLPVVDLGAPLLRAHFPRAWLDVNREPFELDPRLFVGQLPAHANSRSPRVAGGLGTIPRIVAENEEIYDRPLPVAEGLSRIENAYLPYHAALGRLVGDTRRSFGCAVLVDCHSMPSSVRSPNLRGRPDFVLGDRHGASCAAEITNAAETVLTRFGYDVSRNRPYAGGHITEHYGRPADNIHAIQIEVNRGLYLNERTLQKNNGFARLCTDLREVVQGIARAIEETLLPRSEAAE